MYLRTCIFWPRVYSYDFALHAMRLAPPQSYLPFYLCPRRNKLLPSLVLNTKLLDEKLISCGASSMKCDLQTDIALMQG